VAEQQELVPTSFRVIRHVRPKLACTCCDAIVQARRRQAGRSRAASPGRACWHMCLCPWNAKPDAGRLAKGIPKSNFEAYQSGGIDQVGCVYIMFRVLSSTVRE